MKKIIFAVMLLFAFTSFMNLNAQWATTYGLEGMDRIMDLKQTTDGGYILLGFAEDLAGDTDVWILKLDLYGDVEWEYSYGEDLAYEAGYAIQQTTDGGYIVAAEKEGDFWILKLDENGTCLETTGTWQHTTGHADFWEFPRDIQQTSDGGYIVAGMRWDPVEDNYDAWIVKLASGGTVDWDKIWSNGEDEDDFVHSIQQTSDGYIAAGRTGPDLTRGLIQANQPSEAWVFKMDPFGIPIMGSQFKYGDKADLGERALSIKETSDGDYIVVGWSYAIEEGGSSEAWVFKLNPDLSVDWSKGYGGVGNDWARHIELTSDDGYVVGAFTESFGAADWDMWIFKLNANGTEAIWQYKAGGAGRELVHAVQQTSEGGYIAGGTSSTLGIGGSWDIVVLKMYPDGHIHTRCDYFYEETAASVTPYNIIPAPTFVSDPPEANLTPSPTSVLKEETDAEEDLLCDADVFDLLIKVEGGGTTDPIEGTHMYYEDWAVIVDAIPSTGFIFDYWTGTDITEDNKNDDPLTTIMDEDKAITAWFAREYTLTINVDPLEGGTTDPAAGDHTFPEGESVPVTATENEGYTFVNWTGDVTSENKSITVTMTSNKEITANFIAQYTLTIAAGTGGTTNPIPDTYTHDSGAEVPVTAIPSSGYNFSGWSGDASGTTLTVTITMDSNKSITASFTAIPTVDADGDGEKKGGCFIATAAYGSPLHPHLDILRDFRDKYLMPNGFGRKLVELYYRYSPSIAGFIAGHKLLKIAVRINLLPVIAFSSLMVHFGPVATAVVLVFMLVFLILFMRFYPRRVRVL